MSTERSTMREDPSKEAQPAVSDRAMRLLIRIARKLPPRHLALIDLVYLRERSFSTMASSFSRATRT